MFQHFEVYTIKVVLLFPGVNQFEQIRTGLHVNGLFLNYLLPISQNEAWCSTTRLETSLICM